MLWQSRLALTLCLGWVWLSLYQSVQGAATSVTGKPFCGNPVRTDLSFQSLTGDSFAHVIAIDQVRVPGAGACLARRLFCVARLTSPFLPRSAVLGRSGGFCWSDFVLAQGAPLWWWWC